MKKNLLSISIGIATLLLHSTAAAQPAEPYQLPKHEHQTENNEFKNHWKTIGSIQNGNPVITVEKTALLTAYNANLLRQSNIEGHFTDVNIQPLDRGDYALVFTGTKYRSSLYVRAREQSLEALSNTSCTTSDCPTEPRGCLVMYDPDDIGYCSPCENGGKCTKTSSSISLLDPATH
jgi:hypothetical protein